MIRASACRVGGTKNSVVTSPAPTSSARAAAIGSEREWLFMRALAKQESARSGANAFFATRVPSRQTISVRGPTRRENARARGGKTVRLAGGESRCFVSLAHVYSTGRHRGGLHRQSAARAWDFGQPTRGE